jgi:tetratricopeptide (TPR) repeat protein
MKITLKIFVLLLFAAAAWAQVPIKISEKRAVSENQIVAQRALRAESIGDYARALAIWKDLLSVSPWNAPALEGIPRAMLVLKQYDDAEKFVQSWIEKNAFRENAQVPVYDPTSKFSLQLVLGQIALARGDKDKAWAVWNDALAEAGRTNDTVHKLVTLLQQERRWEDSEKLIRDFRKESKQPGFMAMELAMSLRSQMDYGGATQELLLYAVSMPAGFDVAGMYLSQFPDDSTVVPKVTAVLRKAVKADRKNAGLWKVIAGYAHKTGEYDDYLSATIAADSLSDGGGLQVLNAAAALLDEKDIERARHAYQTVLTRKPAPDVASRAEFGLGRCLEALGQYAAARQSYETFVVKYSRFPEADQARFRIADILLYREHDPQSALTAYRALGVKAQSVPRPLVGLRLGDCQAFLGDFGAAIGAWSDVVRIFGTNLGEDATQALLRIARANLWRDSTSKAQDILDSIMAANPTNTAFNDAALYNALLDEGGFHGAVRLVAQGDYADFRGDDSTAAEKFDSAAALLKFGKLAEWAWLSEAEALRGCGKPLLALTALDTFIVRYPESVSLDRAKYTHALIRMEDLRDDKGALSELQNFLLEHPRSIYLEPARKKARQLAARVS